MVMNGKRQPLSLLTREQLPGAHQEYLKSVPVLKPGPAGAPPFDRLPIALQQARQWAFEKIVRDFGWLPNSIACAESWREEFTALRRERLSADHPLGGLPLRVLERAKDSTEVWHSQQVELATTSTSAGGVPLDYRVLAGNVADRTTPVANLQRLQGLLAQLPPQAPDAALRPQQDPRENLDGASRGDRPSHHSEPGHELAARARELHPCADHYVCFKHLEEPQS